MLMPEFRKFAIVESKNHSKQLPFEVVKSIIDGKSQ
jgi:hypothetical protein